MRKIFACLALAAALAAPTVAPAATAAPVGETQFVCPGDGSGCFLPRPCRRRTCN